MILVKSRSSLFLIFCFLCPLTDEAFIPLHDSHLEGEIARIANDIVGLNRQKQEAGGLAASAERARKTLEVRSLDLSSPISSV